MPLRYHYFAYVHHAAASQVTGIELPLVALRFAPLALGTLLLIVIAAASRLFTASSRCAPLAALLFLIASELDLMIADPYPLLGVRDVWFWLSPTYVLGVIVFVLALIAAAALLDRGLAARLGAGPRATWALLLVALLLGSGAKSVVLPTLVGGLGAYAAYAWWRRRAPEPSSIALVLVATVISGLSYALLYLGGGDGGLGVVLGGVYGSMPALAAFEPSLPDSLLAETLFWGWGQRSRACSCSPRSRSPSPGAWARARPPWDGPTACCSACWSRASPPGSSCSRTTLTMPTSPRSR